MDLQKATDALAATPQAGDLNAMMAQAQSAAPAPAPFDPTRFQHEHRIMVLGDAYVGQGDETFLTVHPQELKAENQPALRAKLQKVFTHQEPMWFTAPGRLSIVASLSDLIPLSAEAEGARLSDMIQHYIKKTTTGKDPDAAAHDEKSAAPFAAFVKLLQEDKPLKPDQIEALKNGIGMYLLLEKAVEGKHDQGLNGLAGPLAAQPHNADMLFAKLQTYTGLDGAAIRKVAQEGGLAAVGKALGVDEAYVQDITRLVNHLPDHKFAANAVENWKIGRTQPGMAHAGVHEQIMAGIAPRIEQKIRALQGYFHGKTEVSPDIEKIEQDIAGRLRLLPPAVTEAFFRKGGDIVYSPAGSLNGGGLLGLNRHSKAHADDVLGIDHIYVSGGTGPDKSQDTLVHEITHTVYPNYLTPTDIARTDALALSDRQRLTQLREVVGQWMRAATPEEKAALEQQVETQFAVSGKPWSKIRGNADMNSLYTLVNEAWNNLNAESPKLTLSGYSEPEKRMAEVNSRYAGMRFVRYREQPELLNFVVPGLTEAYDQVYLPHVERALTDLRLRQEPPAKAPAASAATATQSAPSQVRTLATPEAPSVHVHAQDAVLHPPVHPVQQAAVGLQ
jgi:hypothetical protein